MEVLAVSTSGGQISSNEELVCIVSLSSAKAPYMELGCQKAWSVLLTIAWSKRRKSLSSFEILLAVPHFWFETVFRHMYSNYCTAKMSLSSWLDPLCIWDVGGVSTAVFASEARWSKLPNWKLYRDQISSSCGHLWGEAESSGIASDLLRALESTSMSTWSYMILYVYMYMVNMEVLSTLHLCWLTIDPDCF